MDFLSSFSGWSEVPLGQWVGRCPEGATGSLAPREPGEEVPG